MKQHLLLLLQKLFNYKVASQMSNLLGEKEGPTKKAVSYLLPTILGKLAQKTSTEADMGALALTLNKFDTSLLKQLPSLFSGDKIPEAHLNAGQKTVKSIFGKQAEDITETIAAESGLKSKSTEKLIQMVTPLAIGAIAKEYQSNNWDQQTLAKQLLEQKETIIKGVPSQLSTLLGFKNIPDVDIWQNVQRLDTKSTTTATQKVKTSNGSKKQEKKTGATATTSASHSSKSNKWLPILGLLLLALFAFFIFNQISNKQDTNTVATSNKSNNRVVQKTALQEQQPTVKTTPVNNQTGQQQLTNASSNQQKGSAATSKTSNKTAKNKESNVETGDDDKKNTKKRFKKSELPTGATIIDPTAPKQPNLNNIPGNQGDPNDPNDPNNQSPLKTTTNAQGQKIITDQNGNIQNTMSGGGDINDIGATNKITQDADEPYIVPSMNTGKDAQKLGINASGIIGKLATDLSKANKSIVKNDYELDQFSVESDGKTLTTSAKKQLDEIAVVLEAYPEVGITFAGHANPSGDRRADHKKSGNFAYACQRYLMDKGIDRTQLRHERYGSAYAQTRPKNDRVVLKVSRRQ